MQRWRLTEEGRKNVLRRIDENKDDIIARFCPNPVIDIENEVDAMIVYYIMCEIEDFANVSGFTAEGKAHFSKEIYATKEDFMIQRW